MEAKLMVLLAIVAATAAGPITNSETDGCSTTCSTPKKFNYAPSTTYVYDYSVETTTSIAGASEDNARLNIQTRATIEVLTPCEMSLSLSGTRMYHTSAGSDLKAADNQAEFSRALELRPLRFSFQDGRVESVCSQDIEPAWVMNIKKGLLSSFQNSMDDLATSQNVTEADISGSCETEYTSVSSGYYTTSIKKNKNILSCADRDSFDSMFQTVQYKVPSEIQSAPIMKTSQECSQDIEVGGVLKSSTCMESHVFRPFANGLSGGSTTVKQTLTYRGARRGINAGRVNLISRDSLAFDLSANKLDTRQARMAVEQKLADICSQDDITPESPRLFTDLVQAMKSLSYRDMESIYKLLKTRTMCQETERTLKFYMDALPMTGTTAAVKLMTSLMNSEDVTGLQAKAWIASLIFIRAPESDMLVNVKTLIDNSKLRGDAILPVSSLVNNYCRGSRSSSENPAVLSVVRSLERILGYRCDVNDKNFEQILLALRGLGNAGQSTRAVSSINKCLTNSDNSVEIRVAAAEAFRRMPCDAEDSQLWSTFQDNSLDSELRIAAYLALMRCPSKDTLDKMAASLDKEENEQVGAFVYSHLTNLRETSDPHKQEVAQAIASLNLKKDFDVSPLKYSKNYEASLLVNKINTGFGAESNLVWSSETQMPRSLSANLTIELFGQSINLLDFGGRLEGLEHLVKNMFGPALKGKKTNKETGEVEGSIYGRVFGNEMLFMHSKTAQSPFKNLPNNWIELLIALSKEHDYAFTQSAQFLDMSMMIPSVAGLPINVYVNGTGTVDLVLSGKMDLRKMGAKPRSLDIDGVIKPSAAVEITGTMAVDAFVTKTGLRMRNVLHSSTSLKGRVQLDRGQLLNMELDTPEDKMDVFSASSDFYILHDNKEQKQDMITDNRKQLTACTGSNVATITGMELCGEVNFANASKKSDSPYFPFTGPSSARLTLYKRDSHTGYKLTAKRAESKKSSIAQFSFNTPGSRVDRAILSEIDVNYAKQEVSAKLLSPWKKATFSGAMLNNKDIKSVSGNLEVDEKIIYGLTAELKVTESKTKIQFNPMVELRRPGADNLQLVGYAAVQKPYKSVSMDLSLSGIKETPYTVSASFENTKTEKNIRGSFSVDGKNEYNVLASNVMNIVGKKNILRANLRTLFKVHSPERQLVALQGFADYKQGNKLNIAGSFDVHSLLKKPVSFSVAADKGPKRSGSDYNLKASIKAASLSGTVSSHVSAKNAGGITTKTIVDYTIPKVAKTKILLSGKLTSKNRKSLASYTLNSNLNVKENRKPTYNLDLTAEVVDKKLQKNTAATLELKYGLDRKDKQKRYLISSNLKRKSFSLKRAYLSFDANFAAPEHDIDVSIVGKHKHDKKMVDSSINLKYGKDKFVKADVGLKDKSEHLMRVAGHMNVSWPGSEYTMKTDLKQKNHHFYEHDIHLNTASGDRHIISSTYRTPRPHFHDVSTLLRFAGFKPVTVGGSVNLDPRNFASSGEIKLGKKTYGVSTSTSFTKAPRGSVNIEVVYPAKKLILFVDGGKAKGMYDGRVEASWDAIQNPSKKIAVNGSYTNKNGAHGATVGGSLAFSSPFENFEHFTTSVDYGSNDRKHNIDGALSWAENKQISASVDLMKPVSVKHIQMNAKARTPFRGYRQVTLIVNHAMAKKMKTRVEGTMEDQVAKLAIDADAAPGTYNGNVALKTSSSLLKSMDLNVNHKFNNGRTASEVTVTYNGAKYGYDLTMDHSLNGWALTNIGDLTLMIPNRKVSTNWQHKNTDKNIKSTMKSEWAGKRFMLDVSGSHDLFEGNSLTGTIKAKSPWKHMHNIELNVNHKMGSGYINSDAKYKQNGKSKASAMLQFNKRNNVADGKFEITCPFHNDITGRVNANYNKYPATGSALVQWAKKSKVEIEGSVNAADLMNSDAELKITTPVKGYRTLVVRATNAKEGEAAVTHLNINYGVRKSFDIESRLALAGVNKVMRLKLQTPIESFRTLDTGVSFNGHATNFNSAADFEVLPGLGKFQGVLNLNYDSDLQGKLRIDTPFRDYPYYELSTSSRMNDRVRKSIITAEYYPSQVYKFESLYAFELPLIFEAKINSPYPEYNDLSVALRHNHSPVSIDSHVEITYQPSKMIEGDLTADWSDNMEGNLVFKTPFEGYEMSKVSARHQGGVDAFASHAEVNAAGQNVVADATYNGGYTSRGVFTFSSPIQGLENLEISMNKKGNNNNIRGGATFTLNGESSQANFIHRMRENFLKSSISLSSPYTEFVKASIDHNGELTNFNNKISVNYGRKYDVDSDISLDYRTPDVTGNGMLKYKLGGPRDIVRLSIGKSGQAEDMTVSGTASFNDEDISVNGAWKSLQGYDGNVVINTPFQDFKTVGLTISHSGDFSGARSSFDVNYMDNKHIVAKLSATLPSLNRISISTELYTPFENFESTVLSMRNNLDNYRMNIDGKAELTTTIGEFGTGNIVYRKTGSLNNLVVGVSAEMNGNKMTTLKLTNTMVPKEIHSKLNFNTVATEPLTLTFDHTGDMGSCSGKALSQYGKNRISGELNMKHGYNDIDADASVTYSIYGIGRNTGSITIHKDGDLYSFNTRASGKLGNDAASVSLSKSGPTDNMSVRSLMTYNTDKVSVEGSWKNQKSIEGSIRAKTPFTGYRNVGMKLNHAGDLTDFASGISIDYEDNKNVNGDVKLSVDGLRKIRFSTEVNTPFENLEKSGLKFTHDYDQYSMAIAGNVQLTASFPGYYAGQLQYSKTGALNNLVVESKALLNRKELASIKITNNVQGNTVTSAIAIDSHSTPQMTLSLFHSGTMDNFNSNVRAMMGKKNVISSEISLKTDRTTIDAFAKAMYSLKNYGSNQGSIHFEKQGEQDDVTVKAIGKYGNDQVVVSGDLKRKDGIAGSMSVDTGMRGYRNVGASFRHSGNMDRFNTEAKMNIIDGEVFSTKIIFYRYQFRRIETTVELKTPIQDYEYTKLEYRHEGQDKGFTCYATAEYHGDKKITYDLKATTKPNPDFSIKVKTPFANYDDLQVSGSYKNNWPKLAASGKLNAGNGNAISINGDLDASRNIVGSLTLSTPIENFKNIGLDFEHSGSPQMFSSSGNVKYMDGKTISGKLNFKLPENKNLYLLAELKTPFSGFELTKYEQKIQNGGKFVSTSSLVYGVGKMIDNELTVSFFPYPSFSWTMHTPYQTYEELKASGSYQGSESKYELKSSVSAGRTRTVTLVGDFDSSDGITGHLTLSTPVEGFRKIGLNVNHKGTGQKFESEGKVTYMDNKSINANVNFYRYAWRRLVASAELSTPFSGFEKTKVEADYEDNSNSISATAALDYNNGRKINGNLKFTSSPNYDMLVTLNTPFDDYRTIRVQGSLDTTAPSYSMSSSLNLGRNNAYSANGKLNLYSMKNVDGSMDLSTPFDGMRFSKVDYKYTVNYPRADGMISLNYDNGKVISGELQSTVEPAFDASLAIKTPFYGYENMKAAATYDKSYYKYDTSSSLQLGGQVYSMTSGLDYSVEAIKASTKISTPYRNFRNVEAVITHQGTLKNFQTTGFFSSPMTKNVNAMTAVVYNSLNDMSLTASLKSALPNMDDLSLELKVNELSGEKKGRIAAGWTDGQEIVADGVYRFKEGWYQNEVHSDLSLSTPFVAIRNVQFQVDHTGKTNSGEQKVQLELNGTPLLNMDVEYKSGDKYEGSVTFTDPWPMEYTASASSDAGLSVANAYANWNREDVSSNVRLIASCKDQSNEYNVDREVDVSLESASRKMGIYSKMNGDGKSVSSNGKVYWDSVDSSKVSYDVAINDNSRRGRKIVDGSFKLGLPSRTLSLSSSGSENKATKSGDLTFSWDDSDDSKQVGMKASMTQGEPIKGEVTLIMPAIRKEISVSGTVKANSGRVIFDTKTDISFSKDSSKTLTLTSRLEDIRDYSSNYNYSLALGVKHPHTNVDIQMNSHLGSSDEKMTMGLNANYLTAQRQTKNMALLAEINTLKRLISLTAATPLSQMEIVGDVVSISPYKVRMVNRLNGKEAFRSDLTIDSDRQTLVANAIMGEDAIAFGAKYPNKTAFRADVRHFHDGSSHEEALLALRLNTSRLLHTRLAWNPEMLDELRALVVASVAMGGDRVSEELAIINQAVAEELTAKYQAIAQSSLQELRPVLNVLGREMHEISNQLRELSASLREMYQRNDYYIQNMGAEVNQAYMALMDKLNILNRDYIIEYTRTIREIIRHIRKISSYPLGEHYTEMVKEAGIWIDQSLDESLEAFSTTLAALDQTLREYRDNLNKMSQSAVDSVYNNTYIHAVSEKINAIRPYVQDIKMPEAYTNAIYNVHSAINEKMSVLNEVPQIAYVRGGMNEVYQQGLWAYNYWQVEENIYRHLQSIAQNLRDIIHDEMTRNIQLNPITVWLPNEVQMDLPLPVDVHRLDSLEDLEPVLEKAEAWLEKHMPDQTTWDKVVKAYQTVEVQEDDVQKDFKNFKPSRRLRKMRKGLRM